MAETSRPIQRRSKGPPLKKKHHACAESRKPRDLQAMGDAHHPQVPNTLRTKDGQDRQGGSLRRLPEMDNARLSFLIQSLGRNFTLFATHDADFQMSHLESWQLPEELAENLLHLCACATRLIRNRTHDYVRQQINSQRLLECDQARPPA